jgi:UDP-N-acetylmuramoyl-tripeptide--D-alanyl-D-alanine ligase
LRLTLGEIANIVKGRLSNASPETTIKRVITDSRMAKEGDLFIAIRGERFDGVDFVRDAINKGALAALVPENYSGEEPHIKVKDTVKALHSLAKHHRNSLRNTLVIAITGSVGKTTTKELIYHLLKSKYRVRRAIKSYNNYIGVPLTILDTGEDTEILVAEVGINHPGETRPLAELLKPHFAVLTRVGRAHLEFFGSLKEIALEKSELFKLLKEGGKAILNIDSPHFEVFESSIPSGVDIVTYGIEGGDVHPESYKMDEMGTEFILFGKSFHISIPGRGALSNALAAVTVALSLGIDYNSLKSSLLRFEGVPMRMERKDLGKITVVNDAYNSNPDSLLELFETFKGNSKRRRILVLGDMLELGEKSKELHFEAGKILARMGYRHLITIGKLGKIIGEGARSEGLSEVFNFDSVKEAAYFLKGYLKDGDVMLLKASRKMGLEKLVEILAEDI